MPLPRLLLRCPPMLIAFAVLAAAGIANIQGTDAAAEEQPDSEYDHLLYFVTRRGDRQFVDDLILQRIPGKDEADQPLEKLQRVVLTQAGLRPNQLSTSVLGVYGGHLLMIRMGRLQAVDLHTGEPRELMETAWETNPNEDPRREFERRRSPPSIRLGELVGDRVVLLTGQRPANLVELDLRTLNRRSLHREPPDEAAIWGWVYPRLAIAPGGARLAVTNVTKSQDPRLGRGHSTITVVERDKDEPTARRIPHEFPYRLELTGGGNNLHTPFVGWQDDETLLIVSLAIEEEKAEADAGLLILNLDQTRYVLHAWNANTGELTEVGPLPSANSPARSRGNPEPRFWRRPDGELLLHIPVLGDYRIDLEKKEFVHTKQLTSRYVLHGHPDIPELWFDKSLVGVMSPHCRISLSPDGKQAAWLTWLVEQRGPTFRFGPVPMLLHSARLGTRDVTTAQFDAPYMTVSSPDPPLSAYSTAPVIWLRSNQLETSPRFLPEESE
jgi:hypothetical protein